MERELPPVGEGDPVAVRLTVQRGPEFVELSARSYVCSVGMDTALALLADALTAELQRSGVRCSGVMMRAGNQTLDASQKLRDGCTVPTARRRQRGCRLEIAFSVKRHCQRADGVPSPRISLSAEEVSWGLLPTRFTLGDELGRGSYGQVRAAWDAISGDVVAVKCAKCRFDNLVIAKRLLREVQLLRQVDSAHLVKLRDVCLADGETPSSFNQLFLVFDKCEGDLQEMISRGPALEETRVAQLLQGVLGGVACLHDLSILHRDLRTARQLFAQQGRQGSAVRPGPVETRTRLHSSGPAAPGGFCPAGLGPSGLQVVQAPRAVTLGAVWRARGPVGRRLHLRRAAPARALRRWLAAPLPREGSAQSPESSSLDPSGDMLAVIWRVLGPRGELGELAAQHARAIADAEAASAASPGVPLRELLPLASDSAMKKPLHEQRRPEVRARTFPGSRSAPGPAPEAPSAGHTADLRTFLCRPLEVNGMPCFFFGQRLQTAARAAGLRAGGQALGAARARARVPGGVAAAAPELGAAAAELRGADRTPRGGGPGTAGPLEAHRAPARAARALPGGARRVPRPRVSGGPRGQPCLEWPARRARGRRYVSMRGRPASPARGFASAGRSSATSVGGHGCGPPIAVAATCAPGSGHPASSLSRAPDARLAWGHSCA
ncbi:unnamed protein product [Prorocentrum cordatum]|uniref:Cyclin-dependent kinase 2 homolog n=1 Tax=Prorocentrum cordatum TaxID=2364126 RepID=A0ABN9RTF2_9DINO|nr:unnamed protein product [Polarella glacialis]